MFKSVENPLKMVRMLKGAPLSVYFAMFLAGQPVSAKWLERVTGYTDKPITQALELLKEYDLVSHNRRGFCLIEAIQGRLGAPDMRQNKKYEMLKEFGIGEPVLSELANKEDFEEKYINDHIEAAKIEKISAGLLIHRIRSGDKPKKLVDENDYRRYLKGPYRNFGVH